MPREDPIAIFGCGLIGASLAAAWSASGLEIWGCDRRELAALRRRGWLARQIPPEELNRAAVVVLALPLQGILGALRRLPFQPGQLVTDTGSVKGPVVSAARSLPEGVLFVAGHPLTGGTASGLEAARADLFRGAAWALVPQDSDEARLRLESLVRRAGAEPVACEADRHDRLVALTSHLPQLLSVALAAEIESSPDPLVARLLGPGGRDFLRLGGSPYPLWREILAANQDWVERALAAVLSRASLPPEALEEDFRLAAALIGTLDGDPPTGPKSGREPQ
jgi:prephenate dehydrogenase